MQHGTVGDINAQLMKDRSPADNVAGETRSADEGVQRQLETKGRYTGKADDAQIAEYEEMKEKLDKRGNPPQ